MGSDDKLNYSIVIPTIKQFSELEIMSNDILKTTGQKPFFTMQKTSAAINRNIALNYACDAEIIIMLDDDITGFYDMWVDNLLYAMRDQDTIICSARLLNSKGEIAHMMGGNTANKMYGIVNAENNRVTTACIAIRNNKVRFDENYLGSGYEDTDYMNQINKEFPTFKVMVNNDCRLIHINEQKNQGGEIFEHNKKYYLSKWNDETAKNQKDWTHGKTI